jgi:SAM-dependent methyltransferase
MAPGSSQGYCGLRPRARFGDFLNVSEEDRVRLAYRRRRGDSLRYSLFTPGQLYITQSLERRIIETFRCNGFYPLRGKKVLEVGCGTGWALRELLALGARPENLAGVDLLDHAVEEAERLSPKMDLRCVNAENLPFPDRAFDMVMQLTTFTSILDHGVKKRVAGEMLRVLSHSGIVLWYDYFVSKPTNPDVKGIGRREILRLFPDCSFDFRKVTLAPPITRAVAPHSFLLCYLLDKIAWLRTHYLVVVKKGSSPKELVRS